MDKVLIFTNDQDIHTDLVLRELVRRGIDVVRMHTDRYPCGIDMTHRADGETSVRISDSGKEFLLSEITAVWYRRPKEPVVDSSVKEGPARAFAKAESQHALESMYVMLEGARWVNPYWAARRARYKLLQERVAREVGLEMPASILTNEPEEARAFIERHRDVVYKCVRVGFVPHVDGSTDVIFTSKLDSEARNRLEDVRLAPCVFQQYVHKQLELRVTVVGRRVFSCAILSQEKSETSIDWRRGSARHEIFSLPNDVEKRLLCMMEKLGLVYGAFDLILTPDGRFVTLEVNPNGQWAFVQGYTGMPIAGALADLLSNERS